MTMIQVPETKTICRRGPDGLLHCRVRETGRVVPHAVSHQRESAARSSYLHGGYATEISFERYVSEYYNKG